eukprot:9130235-Alexandrium_andersonii.AAC.1
MVTEPSGQNCTLCPRSSMRGRGPSLPNGPNAPRRRHAQIHDSCSCWEASRKHRARHEPLAVVICACSLACT